MKFKFTPQRSLLVGGLVAATYASACYYAETATLTVCFYAGTTTPVDYIGWWEGQQPVYATSDWNHGYQDSTKQYLNSVTTMFGGNRSLTYTQQIPQFCYGPAKFTDPAGNTDTLPYWENGIASGGNPGVPLTPASGEFDWGVPNGDTCP